MLTTFRRYPVLLIALTACARDGALDDGAPDMASVPADCEHFPEACPCRDDSDCRGALPLCDPMSQKCVASPPPATDCVDGWWRHDLDGGNWLCEIVCQGNIDCTKIGGGSLCCDGHCVIPATDEKNCGGCGAACPAPPNGTPACVEGHCIFPWCDNPGFEDCDHNPINGCETTIASDPDNCGKCGNVCKPFPNGLPTCTNGRCTAICAPDFGDCDGLVPNGCEQDLSADPKNCGACGKVCAPPLVCANGQCA